MFVFEFRQRSEIFLLLFWFAAVPCCSSFPFQQRNARNSNLLQRCRSLERTTTRLSGGYDATVGRNPNLAPPIEFYTLQGGLCPYAARTHIVLLELGLEFETFEVSGKPDWYLNINPRGKVPAIRHFAPNEKNGTDEDDPVVVYESAICNEYLCDYCYCSSKHDGDNDTDNNQLLMPTSPAVRAKIRLLNDHYDTVVGPAQFTYLMNKDATKDAELQDALHAALEVYEEALRASGGPYFTGGTFTLADAHAAPFVLRLIVSLRHFKQGYEVPRDRFPRLLEWYRACAARPSVRAAAPSEEQIVQVYRKFVDRDYSFGGLNQNQ